MSNFQYNLQEHGTRRKTKTLKPFTRASGRELGPENQEFFGPCEMASSLRFSGQNPLQLAQVMVCIKNHYVQGHINHRCIGSFMYKSPRVTLKGQCHKMDITVF
jgi:hypothetical protein